MARINNELDGCPQLEALETIDRSGRWDIMKDRFKQDLMQPDPSEFPNSLGRNTSVSDPYLIFYSTCGLTLWSLGLAALRSCGKAPFFLYDTAFESHHFEGQPGLAGDSEGVEPVQVALSS